MIGMRVGQHDGVGPKPIDFAKPVRATINDDAFPPVDNNKTAVLSMTA